MTTNPFPGLRPFEADENHLFFGRDGQSDEMLTRLRCNRFVAVVGTSGSGKSSLIRAGLLPSLHGGFMVKAGSRWRVAVFRPGIDPIHNLASALNAPGVLGDGGGDPGTSNLIVETTLRRGAFGLIEAIRHARMPAQENLLIVVDQFEELFRFKSRRGTEASEEDAAVFVKLLIEASRQSEVPIYVVITMRSDFLGDCARFRELPETINEGLYLIPLMTRAQLREAIAGPVAVAGGEISPPLVNRLLNDVGGDPEKLPILQHALMRTWTLWTESHGEGEPIQLRHYEETGGMAEALSRHADEAYYELSDDQEKVAEKTFRVLTEKGPGDREVRRPTRVAEICAITGAGEEDVIAIIENFRRPGRSFLMPPFEVPLNSESLIDISHESLIGGWKRLRDWVDGEALSAAIYRRVADTAVLYGKEEAALWGDPDLQVALGWRDTTLPTKAWGEHYHPGFEAAMGFLDESKNARDASLIERERQRRQALRRTRTTAVVLAVAFIIACALGVFAMKQTRRANVAAATAEVAAATAEQEKQNALASKKEAEDATKVAERALAEAKEERRKAVTARLEAEKQKKKAEEQTAQAEASLRIANDATLAAKNSERRAQEQTRMAEQLALRMRKETITNGTTLLNMTGLLAQTSPSPQQSVYLHLLRSIARSQMRDHEGAIKDATLALDTGLSNQFALSRRGYEYLLAGKGEEAVKDFEAGLKNNPKDSNQFLNLSIGLGMLGRHAEAIKAANQAVDNFSHEGTEWYDSEVSQEIQDVTAQPVLYADGDAFKTALKYQPANLLAFSGAAKDDFAAALEKADEEARKHPRPWDAYLVALNWAWLHQRSRPEEYGALVIKGALWERASASQGRSPKLARDYFEQFLNEHRRQGDPRYDDLAKWVTSEMLQLGKRRFPVQKANKRTLELAIRTEEEMARTGTASNRFLDDAIKEEPGNVDLRIKRVMLGLQTRKFDEALLEDCKKILEIEPKTRLARVILQLVSPDQNKIEQLRKLLEYAPTEQPWLTELSEKLAETGKKEEALSYLERSISVSGVDADLFYRKAKLLVEKGSEKDLDEARKSIARAIDLKPDDHRFYDEQERIERAIVGSRSSRIAERSYSKGDAPQARRDETETERVRRRAAGYNTAADAMVKRFEAGQALDTYVKSLKFLVSISKDQPDADVRWDMAVTIHKIAKLIEQQGSQAKAIEHLKIMFGDVKGLETVLNEEIRRLTSSPGM